MSAILDKLHALGPVASKWSVFSNDPLDGDAKLLSFVDAWFPRRENLTFLEIGTCRGVSASILAQRGIVLTIDVQSYAETECVIQALGHGQSIFRLIGPPQVTRAVVKNRFDVAWIDGKHTYENLLADFDFCQRFTDQIIMHDHCKKFPGIQQAVAHLQVCGPAGVWTFNGCFAGWQRKESA